MSDPLGLEEWESATRRKKNRGKVSFSYMCVIQCKLIQLTSMKRDMGVIGSCIGEGNTAGTRY